VNKNKDFEKNKILINLIKILGEESVLFDEPLKNHTTIRLGGCTDFLVTPNNFEKIILTLEYLKSENINFFVIGNGSNLIFSDDGFCGVVIKINKNMNEIVVSDDFIISESGSMLPKISSFALDNELSGIEFACGIPATVGGAVVMNAGANGGEMKDIIEESVFLNEDLEVCVIDKHSHNFSYRKSIFRDKKAIILKSTLKLKKMNKKTIEERVRLFTLRRVENQPLDKPSAGSVFKNPSKDICAWELIEKSDLRGKKIGGALISQKHAGFIVNDLNSTSKDVINLIKFVQNAVYKKFNIMLKTEVKMVDKNGKEIF
jgi:UDP-N-acetylmuramate dehydrogenase